MMTHLIHIVNMGFLMVELIETTFFTICALSKPYLFPFPIGLTRYPRDERCQGTSVITTPTIFLERSSE